METLKPIEVDDLRVDYTLDRGQRMQAVRGLSFTVNSGEIVGFLGPNGAGKSSTLKALMGFVTPSSGRCSIFGTPAGTVESRQHVGYLPEVALYYPYLTPVETLTLYGELQGLGGSSLATEIDRLLVALNIQHARRKQNRSLSKGMLQRVGIAQALLGEPKLLVLDEVTSGLDPVGRQELRHILKERQRQGATLFFSSHELAEVDMLCDRILLIHQGRQIDERNVTELKESLRKFRLVYTGTASMFGLGDTVTDSAGVHSAQVRSKADIVEAIDRVSKAGGKVVDVETIEGSLEQYFIQSVEAAK